MTPAPLNLASVFSIAITERGGSLRQLDFDKTELSIGRLDENEIVLPRNNVSKHHARVQFRDGDYVVLDLKSTNGTYVNGHKVTAPTVLGPGDKVYIGDYVLSFRDIATQEADPRRTRELHPIEPRARATATADDPAPLGAAPPSAQLDGGKHSSSGDGATRSNRGARRAQPPRPPPAVGGGRPAAPPLASPPSASQQSWALKNATGRTLTPTGISVGRSTGRKETVSGSLAAALQASKAAEAQLRAAASRPQAIAVPSVHETHDDGAVAIAQTDTSAERDRTSDDPALISGEWPAGVREKRATAVYGQVVLPLAGGRHLDGSGDRDDRAEPASEAERLPEDSETGNLHLDPSAPEPMPDGLLRLLMERLCRDHNVLDAPEHLLGPDERRVIERAFDALIREGLMPTDADRGFLVPAAVCEAGGLGPIDRLLETRALRELVAYGPDRILADFGFGEGLAPVSAAFSSIAALQSAARRLCARGGRTLGNDASVEVTLPDGGMAVVLQPPFCERGLVLSLRRAPRSASTVEELLGHGVLSREMLDAVERAIDARSNVVVVGAPQSGVSTLLSALSHRFGSEERVVAIEAVPSLVIEASKPVVLRAEASPRGVAVAIRSAGWLRPERLVIDDIALDQLPEALPLLAGTRGVLAGVHIAAPSGDDAAQLAAYSFGHAYPAGGPQIAAAFQLRLHVVFADGRPRVREVTELRASANGELDLVRLFRADAPEGGNSDCDGAVHGHDSVEQQEHRAGEPLKPSA